MITMQDSRGLPLAMVRSLLSWLVSWLMPRWVHRLVWGSGLFLVALGLAVSCQAGSSTITLTMALSGIESVRWQPVIAEFERQHPDIRIALVEAHESTDDLEAIYADAFEQGNPTFDLVYADIIWVPRFAAAGWLLDISDRPSAEDLADFLPNDLEGGRYQDRLYRIPLRSDIGVLHYRQDLLQQANLPVPTTFDDLVTTAQALRSQQMATWGYLWQGRSSEGLTAAFMEVLAGYGGSWINSDTLAVELDSPAALQAIQFLRRTITQGMAPERVTTYSEEETYRLFQDGEAAFLRNWPETWATVNSSESPVSGMVAIAPVVHAPGQESRGCQGGWGLAIAASTPHADAAWAAVQFFTQRQIQRRFALDVGYLPSRISLYSDPAILQHYHHYPDLLPMLERSVRRPAVPHYTQASEILQRYLHAALTDRLSPEQAIQAIVQETQTLLQDNT